MPRGHARPAHATWCDNAGCGSNGGCQNCGGAMTVVMMNACDISFCRVRALTRARHLLFRAPANQIDGEVAAHAVGHGVGPTCAALRSRPLLSMAGSRSTQSRKSPTRTS